MKYPKSKKTCKTYAEELSVLHEKKYFPIERINKIKNKFALNFAAVTEDELPYYEVDGWKVVE